MPTSMKIRQGTWELFRSGYLVLIGTNIRHYVIVMLMLCGFDY